MLCVLYINCAGSENPKTEVFFDELIHYLNTVNPPC